MSIPQNLFIGPYAIWYVPCCKRTTHFTESMEWEMLVQGGILFWQNFLGDLPEMEREGVRCHRFVFMPAELRIPGPVRELEFSPEALKLLDLTEVDRTQEIDWFAMSYSAELAMLEKYFETQPAFRWGVVSWM